LALLALWMVDRPESSAQRRVLLAGVFTGGVALFRHDLGAYTAAGIVLALTLTQWRANPAARSGSDVAALARGIVLFGAGMAAVITPVIALLVAAVPIGDLYESLIHSPSSIYPPARRLPFPGTAQLPRALRDIGQIGLFVVYVPFVAAVWGAAVVWLGGRAGSSAPASRHGQGVLLPALVITCILFTLKGVVRVSVVHMVQALVLAILVLALGSRALVVGSPARRLRLGLALAPAVLAVLLLAEPLWTGVRHVASGATRAAVPGGLLHLCRTPPLPRLRCLDADPDYLAAAGFLLEHSTPGDRIYVGTERHDKIFISGVALYFIAERLPVTKWHELHPGVQTREDIQREMISEMQVTPPRWVILDDRWDHMREPNASGIESGVLLLDQYLGANFQESRRFGSVKLLAPRAPAWP
jgi:hypothetical protein